MLPRPIAAALTVSLVAIALPAFAQSPSKPQNQPAYTLQAGTRVVLTDVAVTDRKGNPVHGLKASDFEIYDNNKPQVLASFEEHTTTPVASLPRVSTAPGVYSNAFLEHLPPVLNIIVLDTTNLEIVDQMYLNYQLTCFFKALPPGEPVAIYLTTGPAGFLLQNFTSDRTLLLAALHKALPRFPPNGRLYYNDFTTLQQIADDFGQYPGRKNILWFSGGSTLYLKPDPDDLPTILNWRSIYDELETSRIAIYPIDARGLTVTAGYSMWAQHVLMNDIAQTTGGHAFYDTNGFSQSAAYWLSTSGSFYTLTYSPAHFRPDNQWHKVSVKLKNSRDRYSLSYRHGYFADDATGRVQPPGKPRRRLLVSGESVTPPDLGSAPIVFQASITPASETAAPSPTSAPPKKGTTPYSIHYSLPAAAFTPKTIHGENKIELGVVAVSFDRNGAIVTRIGDRISFTENKVALRHSPNARFPIDQRINLRKGQNYLYLAVWDMHSGRLGTLQIPFLAPKLSKAGK